MTSIEYQGYYILGVYGFLCLVLGLQFGLLSWALPRLGMASAALWTLLEWIRLQPLCGFSFNPVGLAWSHSIASLQCASLFGILGLSFATIFLNVIVYRVLNGLSWKALFLGTIPYLVGLLLLQGEKKGEDLKVTLVQTGLLPSEKVSQKGRGGDYISLFNQWTRVVDLIKKEVDKTDLIVLPEAVVSGRADIPYFSLGEVTGYFLKAYGERAIEAFPPLEAPYALKFENWRVTHLFWGQTLANLYRTELIAGLDGFELGESFNSAFHFQPGKVHLERYDKRILLPLAEMLPFEWCRRWTGIYGINEFFTPGRSIAPFFGKVPMSLSICYEETFSAPMREARLAGGELFVNLTNDNYYPHSTLPEQHLEHGRIRAVENGIPQVRACNTGVSALIDSHGRIVAKLGVDERKAVLLNGSVELKSHQTLFMIWGNGAIVGFSCLILMLRKYFICLISTRKMGSTC